MIDEEFLINTILVMFGFFHIGYNDPIDENTIIIRKKFLLVSAFLLATLLFQSILCTRLLLLYLQLILSLS